MSKSERPTGPKENPTEPKTYKREVALVMLTFWAGMSIWGVWEPEAKQAFEFITLPVFTFAGGAFAIDAAIKQGGYRK